MINHFLTFKEDFFIENEFSFCFDLGTQTFFQDMTTVSETRRTLTANRSKYGYLNSIPLLFAAK